MPRCWRRRRTRWFYRWAGRRGRLWSSGLWHGRYFCWRRRWRRRHGAVRGPILEHRTSQWRVQWLLWLRQRLCVGLPRRGVLWASRLLPLLLRDGELGGFDGVHGSFNHVRLDGDGDGADPGHTVLGGVHGVFMHDTLALVGLGPVLFKETFADPSVARPGEGLGEDAAVVRGKRRSRSASRVVLGQGGRGRSTTYLSDMD